MDRQDTYEPIEAVEAEPAAEAPDTGMPAASEEATEAAEATGGAVRDEEQEPDAPQTVILRDNTDYQQTQLQQARRMRRLEEKRRRQRQQRMVLGVLLVILVLAALLIVRGCMDKKASAAQQVADSPDSEQSEQQDVIATEPDSIINIAAVGDIMCYQDQMDAALQEDGSYDFTAAFAAVSGYTIAADLTVGNLELNFCGEPYSGKPDFRAPDALAETLAAIGFDVLQTANTYSIQNGLAGLRYTIQELNNVGISHVGTYAVEEDKATNDGVLLKNVSGIKIAFISYTKGLNGLRLPDGSEYAVDLFYSDYDTDFSELDTDAVLKSVEAAKALEPDIIIAMLHWGNEGDSTITDVQEDLTNLLFDNGVDAILGTHSHMVSRLETRTVNYDGKEKTCFVAYSLGNFYSSMSENYAVGCRKSIVLNLEFTKNGETGETALSGISYTPIYFVDSGEDAETRFEVLPIRSAISSNLFPDKSETLTQAIADLRKLTDSDYDSGK